MLFSSSFPFSLSSSLPHSTPPSLYPSLLHSRPKIYALSDGEWQLHSISNPIPSLLLLYHSLECWLISFISKYPSQLMGKGKKLTERARYFYLRKGCGSCTHYFYPTDEHCHMNVKHCHSGGNWDVSI